MKVKELLELVRKFLSLLEEYSRLWRSSPRENKVALKDMQKELYRIFYRITDYLSIFSDVRYMSYPATGQLFDAYRTAIGNDDAIIKGPCIDNVLLELEGIISKLETIDPEQEILTNSISVEEKKVFISHGNRTKALDKVERYLRGLGLTPIVVMDEPSMGMAVDDLIDENMNCCIAVIILATCDDKIDGVKDGNIYFQPRPNVIHEIGLAQEKLKDKIIYLKEEGCAFPSNISPKIWENFTQENMEDAYLKIGKELRAFGVIQ